MLLQNKPDCASDRGLYMVFIEQSSSCMPPKECIGMMSHGEITDTPFACYADVSLPMISYDTAAEHEVVPYASYANAWTPHDVTRRNLCAIYSEKQQVRHVFVMQARQYMYRYHTTT